MQELRIVMEWCDAGSLLGALSDGRLRPVGPEGDPSSFEAICTTLLEVATALDHLHCMRIMHCDLKAKNVLLSSSGVSCLCLGCSSSPWSQLNSWHLGLWQLCQQVAES